MPWEAVIHERDQFRRARANNYPPAKAGNRTFRGNRKTAKYCLQRQDW
jgi:hypothetical protein